MKPREIKFKYPVFAIQEQLQGPDKRICIGTFPVRGFWSDMIAVQIDDVEEGIEKHFPGFDHIGEGSFKNHSMESDDVLNSFHLESCETHNEWDDLEFNGPGGMMQFTGLYDKNGVEIWEGDIVYLAGLGNTEMRFPFIELYEAAAEKDIGEIIGNIYENPELLK